MSNPSSMTSAFALTPAWFQTMGRLNTTAITIACQSQVVMMQRLVMIATRPEARRTHDEQERMVSEKLFAAMESGTALTGLWWKLAMAWPTMFNDPNAGQRMIDEAAVGMEKALKPYATRVKANARRLSR